jgi:hypothetical protein
MRHLVVLFIHFLATLARLLGPGGVRSLVAESLLLKHQLLILNRSRQRSPNLSARDRILAGWMAILVRPTRLLRSAILLKPSTLLGLHKAMSKQKYRMLFSPKCPREPGPKGPGPELIHLVVEMKQRNSNWGCPRIAQQIAFPPYNNSPETGKATVSLSSLAWLMNASQRFKMQLHADNIAYRGYRHPSQRERPRKPSPREASLDITVPWAC